MTRNATGIINRDHALGSAYPVSLDAFDGPLDLLLQLIERNELDISEVSLCAVTDQYLETLDRLAVVDPAALADFLSVASRLLYLKSNSLLPRPGKQDEEEEDTGDALIRQLIEYRRFRQAADELKARSESGQSAHVRPATKPSADRNYAAPPDLSAVSADDLQAMLARALQRIPVEPPPPRVAAYPITLAEQIERVRNYVRDAQRAVGVSGRSRVLFSAVLGTAYTRTEVIVTFLAILELIKQEELGVQQDSTFGEIYLLPLEKAASTTQDGADDALEARSDASQAADPIPD